MRLVDNWPIKQQRLRISGNVLKNGGGFHQNSCYIPPVNLKRKLALLESNQPAIRLMLILRMRTAFKVFLFSHSLVSRMAKKTHFSLEKKTYHLMKFILFLMVNPLCKSKWFFR